MPSYEVKGSMEGDGSPSERLFLVKPITGWVEDGEKEVDARAAQMVVATVREDMTDDVVDNWLSTPFVIISKPNRSEVAGKINAFRRDHLKTVSKRLISGDSLPRTVEEKSTNAWFHVGCGTKGLLAVNYSKAAAREIPVSGSTTPSHEHLARGRNSHRQSSIKEGDMAQSPRLIVNHNRSHIKDVGFMCGGENQMAMWCGGGVGQGLDCKDTKFITNNAHSKSCFFFHVYLPPGYTLSISMAPLSDSTSINNVASELLLESAPDTAKFMKEPSIFYGDACPPGVPLSPKTEPSPSAPSSSSWYSPIKSTKKPQRNKGGR